MGFGLGWGLAATISVAVEVVHHLVLTWTFHPSTFLGYVECFGKVRTAEDRFVGCHRVVRPSPPRLPVNIGELDTQSDRRFRLSSRILLPLDEWNLCF
jgi:hypothetical protein